MASGRPDFECTLSQEPPVVVQGFMIRNNAAVDRSIATLSGLFPHSGDYAADDLSDDDFAALRLQAVERSGASEAVREYYDQLAVDHIAVGSLGALCLAVVPHSQTAAYSDKLHAMQPALQSVLGRYPTVLTRS